MAAKAVRRATTTSVVLPARDEEATVAEVVAAYAPLRDRGLVDELLVVDSWSTDRTAARARAAGADVVHVAEVFPEVEAGPGKGEAMWRGLGATTGDLVAFCDADVLDAGPALRAGPAGADARGAGGAAGQGLLPTAARRRDAATWRSTAGG